MSCILQPDALEAIEVKVPESVLVIIEAHFLHEEPKPYLCTCGRAINCLATFFNHLQTHLESLTCTVCCKSFETKQSLVRHTRRLHEESEPYNCKYCAKLFPKKFLGLEHERAVHRVEEEGQKEFRCTLCSRGFDFRANLDTHVRSHESGDLTCSKCQKVFTHSFKKRKHERDFHRTGPNTSPRLICHFCNGKFSRKDSLLLHVKRHVMPREEHVCHLCAKILPWPEALRVHLKTHTVKLVKVVKCDLCALELSNINCLRAHRKQVHGLTGELRKRNLEFLDPEGDDGPMACPICSKVFQSRRQCKLHELRHGKTLTCVFCGLQVNSRMQLTLHERQHTGQIVDGLHKQNKECESCHRKFGKTNDLINHLKVSHGIVKELKCNLCEKKFMFPNKLKVHLKEHVNPELRICSFCGKTFASERSCYMHKRYAHNK